MAKKIFSVALLAAFSAAAGHSEIIETNAQQSGVAFTVPSVNLLQSATLSVNNTSYFAPQENVATTNLGVLTNLAFGPGDLTDSSQVVTIENGAKITYTFSAPATISSISTYAGWRDGGRYQQDYQVLYSLATAPASFTTLYTVAYDPTGGTDSSVTLTSATGVLMANVAALQFYFPTTQNGYVGYRELNVQGTVTSTPEPGTGALLAVLAAAVGLGGLVHRRRS